MLCILSIISSVLSPLFSCLNRYGVNHCRLRHLESTGTMSASTLGSGRRNNPFARDSSPSPVPVALAGRPKSMAFLSSPTTSNTVGHSRNQSYSPLGAQSLAAPQASRDRSTSNRSNNQSSTTFAPKFIKSEVAQRDTERVRGIEGENDFSGKRYVWIKDPQVAFVKGWVVEDLENSQLLIQCDDGTVRFAYELVLLGETLTEI